ncbi:O-antigen ligase family protein [Candidatus Fermentibacteria bacterium]|nr:O-antigen ligase family protein [Candidatus Fermentibacteria bacterium]
MKHAAARVLPPALCLAVALLIWYPLRIPLHIPWAGTLWERLHDVTVALLLIASVPSAARFLRTRGPWMRDVPVLYLALCMVSVIPLLGVPTLGFAYARMQWITLAVYGATFLCAYGVARQSPRVVIGLAAAWCSWAVVSAGGAVISALIHGRLIHDAVDAMGHTNSRAGFELVVMLFILGAVWRDAPRLRAAFLPLLLLLATSVTLSLSRGAWMGFLAGLVVCVGWHWGWRRGAVVLAAGVVLAVALPGPVGDRARSVADAGLASNLFRVQVWRAALSVIRENPWGGSGYDTLWFSLLSHLGADTPTMAGKHVHNLLLQTWAETGLLGAAALGGVFAGMLRSAWAMGNGPAGVNRLVGRGVVIALAGSVAHSLVDCTWRDYGQQILFWSLAGWIAGSREHEDAT